MYKFFVSLILSALMLSCANTAKTINGNWQQLFEGFEGEKTGYGIVNDSAIITIDFIKEKNIEFDYRDGLEKDKSDSIIYNHPTLSFRKLNLNKTYNRYVMVYSENCDCFDGVFKSFSGNTIKVKWVRNR